MNTIFLKGLFTVALTGFWAGSGLASPLSSKLLPLVPGGVEIVAGFENHPGPYSHGRLLLTTHNNRLDLDDWQALTGVDNNRIFDEIIEVAASPCSWKALRTHAAGCGPVRPGTDLSFRGTEWSSGHGV